jgi:tetratricopeptide (TPR) repeat protein
MASELVEETRALLEKRFAAATGGDYFGVLGLDDTSGAKQVQDSYFKLAKLLHPDKITASGEFNDEDSQKALQVFKFATEAKDVLADKGLRAKYLKGELQPERVTQSGERGKKRVKSPDEIAKIAFHKGTVLLNKRSYQDAEQFLMEAAKAKPEEPKHWQKLGWAVFQNTADREDEQRLEEAKRCWSKALSCDQEDPESHYLMAIYYKAIGKKGACREALEKALSLKPNYVEAKREIRLLKMRSGKGKKKRSSSKSGAGSSGGGLWDQLRDLLTKKR